MTVFLDLEMLDLRTWSLGSCTDPEGVFAVMQVGKAMSSNESAAYEIMRSLDVDYVLIIFGGVIGYSGDDINKFLWMVRIAEGEHPKDIRVSGNARRETEGFLAECVLYFHLHFFLFFLTFIYFVVFLVFITVEGNLYLLQLFEKYIRGCSSRTTAGQRPAVCSTGSFSI